MSLEKPVFPVTIFYDGACPVCSREMALYRRRVPAGRLNFVDIADPHFDPTVFDRSLEDFMAQMHVRDSEGRFYMAVEGFWAIWQAFPPLSIYRALGHLVSLPGVDLFASFGYQLFARVRRFLPARQQPCVGDHCHLPHPHH